MAERKRYYIRMSGTLVPVTQEVYQTCHQTKRHAKTLYEKDERHGLISYDGMDTEDTLGEEMIPDRDAVSVEDAAIANILRDKLHRCLSMLDESDRQLIHALFYEGLSERQAANQFHISQQTVNYRKRIALAQLKKLFKI